MGFVLRPSAGGSKAPAVLPEVNLRFDGGGRALAGPQVTRLVLNHNHFPFQIQH